MPTSERNRFLLLYGSQTGQARAIAEEIADKAEVERLHAEIHCLSLTEKKFFLERESCVVIVTSTTGDGEPPDTVIKFLRRLKKKTLSADHLSQLNYALLGLGDSNFTNFCNCGKTLDRRLQELGARHFYDSGWADDAVGLEVKVEPWMDGLCPALKKCLQLPDSDDPDLHAQNSTVSPPTTCDSFNNSNDNAGVISHGLSVSVSLHIHTERTDKQVSDTQTSLLNNGDVTSIDIITKSNSISNPNSVSSISHINSSSIMNPNLVSVAHSVNTDDCDNVNPKNSRTPESSNLTSETSTNIDGENTCTFTVTEPKRLTKMDLETAESSRSNVNQETQNLGEAETKDKAPAVAMTASVRQSLPPLLESSLTVPALSPAFLKLEFHKDPNLNVSELPIQNGCVFPSAASPVSMATVMSAVTLTSDSAVKKAMSFTLDISGCGIKYEPGDSFSIACPNPDLEVDALLTRLSIHDNIDTPCSLSILPETKKRRAMVPQFIPACTTLRHIFTTCLNIRDPPKKALLRVLVDHTTEQSERRRLQELFSKQGSDDYARFIREPSLSLQDILDHFPSCIPPVEQVIEHLPRLQPRPFSICCSPLTSPSSIEFVFNVIDIAATSGRTHARKGVCTGWLEQIAQTLHSGQSPHSVTGAGYSEHVTGEVNGEVEHTGELDDRITEDFQKLNISSETKIPVFARTNQHFHLPDDVSRPIILVGPGTGVAPFIGFLHHRAAHIGAGGDRTPGESWLFYGCRHRDRDYLYRSEMEHFTSTGTLTKLCVCFSRDDQPPSSPRYVQDNIRSHGADVLRLLETENAVVYVCGDARNMAKDVLQAFVDVYTNIQGITPDDASKKLTQMRLEKRYLEDVWT